MSIYDDLKPVVSEIMGEFSQGTVSLVSVTAGAGAIDDPGAPTEETTELDATVSGVSYKYVSEGLAVSTDLTVTAAPIDGITVSEKDFVLVDGVRYKIVQDISLPSAGTKLVWKFIVRKG